jgi:hypothetical protein
VVAGPHLHTALPDDGDKADFEKQVGQGPYGEDEPMLQDRFGLTLEQLHWRRWRIGQPDIGGDLRKWRQEFPAFAEEAFISTGHQVFDQRRVQVLWTAAFTKTDPKDDTGPELGTLTPESVVSKRGRHGMVDVPTKPKWTDKHDTGLGARHPFWRVWETPQEDGRYLVVCDPSEGEEVEGASRTGTASRSSTTSPAPR